MTPRNLEAEFYSDDARVCSRVWLMMGQYHVSTVDLEVQRPWVIAQPSKEAAIAYARQCVSIDPDPVAETEARWQCIWRRNRRPAR